MTKRRKRWHSHPVVENRCVVCGMPAPVEFMMTRDRFEMCGSCGEPVDVRAGDIFTFCEPCWAICADSDGHITLPHAVLHRLQRAPW